jgi:hypothetical protein
MNAERIRADEAPHSRSTCLPACPAARISFFNLGGPRIIVSASDAAKDSIRTRPFSAAMQAKLELAQ